VTTQDRSNAIASLDSAQQSIDQANGRPSALAQLNLAHAQAHILAAGVHALLDLADAIRETRSAP
jgi:hypothetical protein